MWAKMQSSALVHFPRLKRLQISLPLEVCVALSVVVVFGLTGGPKRAVIGALSRKGRLLLVALDRLLLELVCGYTLLLG